MRNLPIKSKVEIINEIHANRRDGDFTKYGTESIINELLENIKKSVIEGNKVSLGKFGIFLKKERKERTARNPRTGEMLKVPAGWKIKFIPAKAFKDLFDL